MKKNLINLILLIAVSALSFSQSHLIKIPQAYSTIQGGINKAVNGDTVLVAPGTYFENINFRGKNIVVASNYIIDHDLSIIGETIIDGSKKPLFKDTASCVVFNTRENSTAVLQGFTITNGKGTKTHYPDDGQYFVQGGGIDIINSSPTIKNNIIVNNGYQSTANFNGGGIGINDHSNPQILNNIIQFNQGNFGAGISIWQNSHAIIKNNIISYNIGGQIYGGGGLAIDRSLAIIENNTIVNNVVSGSYGGGGIVFWKQNPESGTIVLKNNIIWGNKQSTGGQFELTESSVANINNSDIEGGYTGTGNINKDPQLNRSNYLLSDNSPCIDAGDVGTTYNDPEDALKIGFAKLPSKGGLKNDMGTYGGPGSGIFPNFSYSSIYVSDSISFGFKNVVGTSVSGIIRSLSLSKDKRKIDSVKVMSHKSNLKIISFLTDSLNPLQSDNISIEWTPTDINQFVDTILIYHNAQNIVNPIKVGVSGKALNKVNIEGNKVEFNIFPNPVNEKLNIEIQGDMMSVCKLYNSKGQLIKTLHLEYGLNAFNINNLENGLYYIQIPTKTGSITQKIVKI